MTYKLEWLLENHIALLTAWDYLTAEQVAPMDREITALLSKPAAKRVHLIVDSSDLISLPDLATMSHLTFFQHDRLAGMVDVGQRNTILRFIWASVAQKAALQIHHTGTIADGLSYLAMADDNLPQAPLESAIAAYRINTS